jgi:lysine 2,3-aminomutase
MDKHCHDSQLTWHVIFQYYVYQADMIPGAEDLRTPLSDSHRIESEIRNQNAGFLLPRFIYDVPATGKRQTLFANYSDRELGLSTFKLPASYGAKVAEYWDPMWSLSEDARQQIADRFNMTGMQIRM